MSKQFIYYPMGVCSRQFDITLSDDGTIVESVTITGGCAGNTQGVAALVKGRPTSEVIALLKGIDCRGKGTSCPDQLAQALEKAVEN
jgi:uncharacterized protein (TIGR03905 family)